MEMNYPNLKNWYSYIKDQCLTFKQAIELQELGINFSNANLEYIKREGKREELKLIDNTLNKDDNTIFCPTLTIAEILEVIPKSFYAKEDEEDDDDMKEEYLIFYDGDSLGYINWVDGEISDTKILIRKAIPLPAANNEIYLKEWNLRDALFELLKWLKQNKLL